MWSTACTASRVSDIATAAPELQEKCSLEHDRDLTYRLRLSSVHVLHPSANGHAQCCGYFAGAAMAAIDDGQQRRRCGGQSARAGTVLLRQPCCDVQQLACNATMMCKLNQVCSIRPDCGFASNSEQNKSWNVGFPLLCL